MLVSKHGLEEPNSDVVALVSHAAQEMLKNFVEKLNVIAEHRVDFNKVNNYVDRIVTNKLATFFMTPFPFRLTKITKLVTTSEGSYVA